MHVVVNQGLVRGKVRQASALHVVALAVFAVGLFISTSQGDRAEGIVASYTAIVIGLLLYNFGQTFLRRWGPRFRQDGVLTKALKGLDDRYTLLAFPSSKLPDYILVGPSGVQVIVPRINGGPIACRGDRWTQRTRGIGRFLPFLRGAALGDPGADVARGVRTVRERLMRHGLMADERALPVGGLVVFTNPEARLRIDGCSQPVIGLKQLRGHLRGTKGALGPMAPQIIRALES